MPKKQRRRPPRMIADRIARCRRDMKASGIGAYLISNPKDCYYLTGFSGEDSAALVTPKGIHLISDRRFDLTINRECPWVTRWMRKGSLHEEIARVCRRLRVGKLAVQHDHLTLKNHAALKKHSRPCRLVKAPPIIARMRLIKDRSELASIKKAVGIAEDAFRAMRGTIRVGQTELELAACLEFEMKQRGSSSPAFATICAEGANAAQPHARPGRRRVKKGSAILFDWGARSSMYRSDLTRMVFVGSIPPKIRRIYPIVLEAQQRAIEAIRPGRRMCDVDKVAREYIAEQGYAEQFNHGLGHGLGLDVHEPPSLSWRSTEKLEAGMVVTVEPGIYLPGVGGVRIEDDVLVTPRGRRVLSGLEKSLQNSVR